MELSADDANARDIGRPITAPQVRPRRRGLLPAGRCAETEGKGRPVGPRGAPDLSDAVEASSQREQAGRRTAHSRASWVADRNAARSKGFAWPGTRKRLLFRAGKMESEPAPAFCGTGEGGSARSCQKKNFQVCRRKVLPHRGHDTSSSLPDGTRSLPSQEGQLRTTRSGAWSGGSSSVAPSRWTVLARLNAAAASSRIAWTRSCK